MLYVSNIKCGCKNFLLATKSGFVCPHCGNKYYDTKICGDIPTVSISSTVDWYEEHKEELKTLKFLDFLGLDDISLEEHPNKMGFVDMGCEDFTNEKAIKLVELVDNIVDDRCEALDININMF